jgi:hypothetical protein
MVRDLYDRVEALEAAGPKKAVDTFAPTARAFGLPSEKK